MFMSPSRVLAIFEDAIRNRRILKVRYQHMSGEREIVERTMAPFDRGTKRPDLIYLFCYEHTDEKTGRHAPQVHPIGLNYVVSMTDIPGRHFDERELTLINRENTKSHFDYYSEWHLLRKWGIARDRDWYR